MFFLGYFGQLMLNWAILSIAALGFRWTFLAGQFSLAHAALMGTGAYAAAQAALVFNVPLIPAIFAGVLVGTVVSILVGLMSLRLDGLFLSIGTLAFGLGTVALIDANEWLGGPSGLTPPFLVEPWTILGSLAILLLVSLIVDATRVGARFRAVSDDALVAESSGVNVRLIRVSSWALGGAILGVAGSLFALSLGSISPLDFGFDLLTLMMLGVLLGGVGTVLGPLIGAAIVVALPEVVRMFGGDRALIYGLILVLLVIVRPKGLLAKWPKWFRNPVLRAAAIPQASADTNADRSGPDRVKPVTRPAKGEPVLSVRNVSLTFGGVHALKDVSFDITPNRVHALIGPNGAGKTTLVNVITGALTPDSGEVVFLGETITSASGAFRARSGLSRTFQAPRLLPSLNLMQNASIGLWASNSRKASGKSVDVRRLLARVGMHGMQDRAISSLNLAEQRRIEMVRALSNAPKLLILDEPAAGMNHVEAKAFIDEINQICQEMETTVLLIEHNMNIVMSVADDVVVLSFGEVIASGPPATVKRDQQVVSAYLGSAS